MNTLLETTINYATLLADALVRAKREGWDIAIIFERNYDEEKQLFDFKVRRVDYSNKFTGAPRVTPNVQTIDKEQEKSS